MIADIFKVLLIDNLSGETFAKTTLESAGIEVTEDTKDVEGGGDIVAVLHNGKKEKIKLQDVLFDFNIMAKQLGVDIVTGKVTAYTFPKIYPVTGTDKTITLEKQPIVKNNRLAIYKMDGTIINSSEYTLTGAVVKFTGTNVAQGEEVEVRTYLYETGEKAQSIEINNKKFPNGVTCILQTLEISEEETPLNTIQFIFDSCVFEGGFKLDTKTKREEIKHSMDLKVIKKRGQDHVGRVLRIPV